MIKYYGKQEIRLPDCFSVGFARQEVTPTIPYSNFAGGTSTEYHDPITATVVALCDGEDVVLICSADIRAAEDGLVAMLKGIAEEQFNIPQDHVIFNVTHNHNGPNIGNDYPEIHAWYDFMRKTFPVLIADALADCAPATAFGGKAYTQALNFVRRYIMSDHTWEMNPIYPRRFEVMAAESKADNEMRVIKFDREGKKPVCLVNWQCHAASAHASTFHSGDTSHLSTADFVHKFREGAEKEYGILFAFQQGAAGNLVAAHRHAELSRCRTEARSDEHPYEAHGRLLVPVLGEALQNMVPLNTGKLRVNHKDLFLSFKQVDPQTMANVLDYWETEGERNDPEKLAKLQKYGLEHYECNCIIKIYRKLPETGKTCPFTTISFGDVGIATAPYEMFDRNGMEVRESSPFKMTFSLGYTDGANSYIPSYWAFTHGSYEAYSCMFEPGTGEKCANALVDMLLDNYLLDHPIEN